MNRIQKNFVAYQNGKPCSPKVAEQMWTLVPSVEKLHEECVKLEKTLFNDMTFLFKLPCKDAVEVLANILYSNTGKEYRLCLAYAKAALWYDYWGENHFSYPDRGLVGVKYLSC